MVEGHEWVGARERGSPLAIRLLLVSFRVLGSRFARVLIPFIAFYFSLFARDGRRASIDYQRRVRRVRARLDGSPVEEPGWLDVYRHFRSFANVIADRLALWGGQVDDFDIEFHGLDLMERVLKDGRGGLLLGAHIGSFDVLRLVARRAEIPVNVVMYTDNAQMINRAFEQLDPSARIRVISVDLRSHRASFEIRECLARGEFVAVLADRELQSSARRTRSALFLGGRAPFSTRPYQLAHLLDVPLVLAVGLRRGRRAYALHFEAIGDPRDAPGRAARSAWVDACIDTYVARLEDLCMQAPLQWFNFYEFWEDAVVD